jgi:hypothetical protein
LQSGSTAQTSPPAPGPDGTEPALCEHPCEGSNQRPFVWLPNVTARTRCRAATPFQRIRGATSSRPG